MRTREGEYFRRGLLVSASLTAIMLACPASATPQGGAVGAGNASIGQSGAVTTIAQGSDRAVIDWQSFDVGAGERVEFRQPSANSVTLNRIHGADPSQIHGAISANGQVVLVNPNGILFGKNAKVNVGGLVASTADTANDAFMAGGPLKLTIPGKADAAIANEGTITAKDAGLVALVAPNAANRGTIIARMGKVQLAGAETATVDLYGDGLVSFAVTDKAKATAVTNSGRIEAGNVLLSAADAASLVTSSANTSGIVEASHMRVSKDGSIVLGGEVAITGREVTVGNGANIRADGRDGGGTVRIGGGWQGERITLEEQQLANARATSIAPETFISANATGKGDGGTVVAWSDGTTRFAGRIEAKGGRLSGNGGKIETSGKDALSVTGLADASAPKGKAGDWLLDPTNVTITQAGGTDITGGGCGAGPYACADISVSANSISSGLSAGNNVTVAATGDITLSSASISKTGGGAATLTLKADGSIVTSGTNSLTSNADKLHTILWADAETVPSNDGYISLINTTITSNGGDIILGGGLDNGADITDRLGTIIYNGIASDGRPDGFAFGNITINHGISLDNGDLSAGDGSIVLRGNGWNDASSNTHYGMVFSTGSSATTTNEGGVYMEGIGGLANANSYGVYFNNAGGMNVSAQSGDVFVKGTSGAATNNNFAIVIGGSNTISVAGSGATAGNIRLEGIANGGGNRYSIYIIGGSTAIDSTDGDIHIYGGGVNSRSVVFNSTSGHITSSGDGNITLYGDCTACTPISDILFVAGAINSTGSGNIEFVANTIQGNVPVQTAGNVAFKPRSAGISINVAGGGGGLDIPTATLNTITAGTITIGDATSGLTTVNPYASWASRASSGVNFLSGASGVTFAPGAHNFGTRSLTATTAGPVAVSGALTAGSALLRTTGASSDITLGAAGSITASGAGNSIVLASGDDFINNNTAIPLSTPSGRWLVYSEDPAQNTQGTLLASFTRDSCTYGGACPTFPATGNGYLYRAIVPGSGGGAGGTAGPSTTPVDPVTPLPPIEGGGSVLPFPVTPALPPVAIDLPRLLEQAFAQALGSVAETYHADEGDAGPAGLEEDHWLYGDLGNSSARQETGTLVSIARELLLQLGCGGDGEDKSCQALKF